MSQLCVPNTNLKLTDGTLVQLNRFPGMKWIVHEGWYTYNNSQLYGWYFSSIPAQTIIPMNDEDLRTLQFVSTSSGSDSGNSSNGCNCGCDHGNPEKPYPPPDVDNCYPHPKPFEIPFDIKKNEMLERAWITVDTISQRNKLNRRQIPNGKIVRVNQVKNEEGPKYYAWNEVYEEWEEIFQQLDTSDFVLKKDMLSEVENKIEEINIPKLVSDEIQSSDTLQNTVKQVADTIVPEVVKNETAKLNEKVDELSTQITEVSPTWIKLPQ